MENFPVMVGFFLVINPLCGETSIFFSENAGPILAATSKFRKLAMQADERQLHSHVVMFENLTKIGSNDLNETFIVPIWIFDL